MARPIMFSLIAALGITLSSPALAAEDDDFDDWEEDDDGDEETVVREKGNDKIDDGDPTGDEDWVEPGGESDGEDLDFDDGEFDRDSTVSTSGPGQDTARIYRSQLEKVADLSNDEEALAWERYMRKYPNSLFKSRIDARMDEISASLYDERVEDSITRVGDAGTAELRFATPMGLEPVDPRSKIRAGFEWGYPGFVSAIADLEYQIMRELSVHGGVHGRYTGANIEIGARYAAIKSARTQFLVTGIADFHMNTAPFYPAFRPQIAVGKRFDLGGAGHIDSQIQGGPDLLITNGLDPRWVGGANITYSPSPTVHAFIETSSYMKDMGAEYLSSSFRFNVFTIGMKFVKRKSATKDQFETGISASAPYTTNYWGYHSGSLSADMNYFL